VEEDESNLVSDSYIVVFISPNTKLELHVCSKMHYKDVILMLKTLRFYFPQLKNVGEVSGATNVHCSLANSQC
jgi:hypothetical protein